jgi:hypothetical protein
MRLTTVAAFFVLGGALACTTDTATSPSASPRAPARAVATLLGTPITAIPLQRTTPLATQQTASAHIGILGGHLSLPGAGLLVVIPPLAVVTPVTVSVTALAGSNVAYEFSPHGLVFLAPLVATQDLSNTEARNGGTINPLSLYLGYFPDSSHVTTITELLDLQINLLDQTSSALLWHFSGYMWSSGREADPDSTATMMRRPVPATIQELVRR